MSKVLCAPQILIATCVVRCVCHIDVASQLSHSNRKRESDEKSAHKIGRLGVERGWCGWSGWNRPDKEKAGQVTDLDFFPEYVNENMGGSCNPQVMNRSSKDQNSKDINNYAIESSEAGQKLFSFSTPRRSPET